MFSPRPRVFNPDYVSDPEDNQPGVHIHEQGNPNLIGDDWEFPSDLGMSRADLYPSPHQHSLWQRFMARWIT